MAIPIAAGVIVLAVVLILVIGKVGKKAEPVDVQAGISYLEALAQKDPADVQDVRREIYRKRLDEQREALIEQLDSGELDPFSLFEDYVLMGDSRAMGLWYWEFMEQDRILADGGHTIRYVMGFEKELNAFNPSYVFMCYGLNDVGMGFWSTGEEYAAEYMEKVDWVKQQAPNATVIVCSILPAMDPAFSQNAAWYSIPEWNIALEAACKEHGILFADCSRLAEQYPELWDVDGVHFEAAFYPHWASILIATALMGGEEAE